MLPGLYGGGAERATLKLAAGLSAEGIPVDLVLARKEGPLLAEVPDVVRVVDLGARRVIFSLLGLVQYMRREKPAVVLSALHMNFIAIWAKSIAGVPTKVFVSERSTLSNWSKSYADIRLQLMPYFVKVFYPFADGVICVSEGVAADLNQMAHLPKDRIHIIYNPIITTSLMEKAEEKLDDPWLCSTNMPVVLSVGRLSKPKNYPLLLHAFSRVRQLRECHLLILGEGEDRSTLEALISELNLKSDVRLPGFVSNPYPYMRRSSVFVLSSRWEGLPGALIEALYCGVPVISTDCPSGPREILADGRYGKLIPVDDEDALVQAILDALDGKVQFPQVESWQPFKMDTVLTKYERVLFEDR